MSQSTKSSLPTSILATSSQSQQPQNSNSNNTDQLTNNVSLNDNANAANKIFQPPPPPPSSSKKKQEDSRAMEAAKQLFCGGTAGAAAKTVTAPLSRLTILFQVHSMVTTKSNRPKFAMTMKDGFSKVVERGGILSMWRGNGTSVLHRFPFSAINFFVYENMLDVMNGIQRPKEQEQEKISKLQRRLTHAVTDTQEDKHQSQRQQQQQQHRERSSKDDVLPLSRFVAGAVAGSTACIACYPLDLVRTRLTTELEGHEHYRGMVDAFKKIYRAEGFAGFYSGLGPTLFVAVPNFAISYTVYGTLKEYALDDDLFYNLRKVDGESGEARLGFQLTLMCGACSGILSTLVTFPFDTIRRRMQIQNLHLEESERLTARQQVRHLVRNEGLTSLYRGLTPEIIKVIPMVGTMFMVYEFTKETLNI